MLLPPPPPPPPPPKSVKDDSDPEVLGERTARGCRLMGLAEVARKVDGEGRSSTRFTGLTEPAREGGGKRVPESAPGKHSSREARRHRQADKRSAMKRRRPTDRQGHQQDTGKTDRPSAMKRAGPRVPCAHARPARTPHAPTAASEPAVQAHRASLEATSWAPPGSNLFRGLGARVRGMPSPARGASSGTLSGRASSEHDPRGSGDPPLLHRRSFMSALQRQRAPRPRQVRA